MANDRGNMNLGQKALQVLRAVAPTLGTAIGGPFGALAGAAVSAALGPGKEPEQALLNANPDQLLALKKADQDFQVQLEQLGITREKLVYDDIANARGREMAVKDRTPATLAYAVTVGFFGTLGFLLWNGKPLSGGDALLVMLGSLASAWVGVVTYYFGSSSGSAEKTKLMAAQSDKFRL